MLHLHKTIFVLLLIWVIGGLAADCKLRMDQHFKEPGPVFMRNYFENQGTVSFLDFLKPDISGDITFKKNELVFVACPGDNTHRPPKNWIEVNNISLKKTDAKARCIGGSMFEIEKKTVPFDNIKCKSRPYMAVKLAKKVCDGVDFRLYEVGYNVQGRLYKVYSACFSPSMKKTSYVFQNVSSTKHMQSPWDVPELFLKHPLFPNADMDGIYNFKNQEMQLNRYLNVQNTEPLTRGHLAASGDFPMNVQRRATYHYVNVAPQWQTGNNGDWNHLEQALRKRINDLNANAIVYTGTIGVMKLDKKPDLFLRVGITELAVPMYFYKIVYDTKTQNAAAFVLPNLPKTNSTVSPPFSNYSICKDFKWLSNFHNGFCFEYDVFKNLYLISYSPDIRYVKGNKPLFDY